MAMYRGSHANYPTSLDHRGRAHASFPIIAAVGINRLLYENSDGILLENSAGDVALE